MSDLKKGCTYKATRSFTASTKIGQFSKVLVIEGEECTVLHIYFRMGTKGEAKLEPEKYTFSNQEGRTFELLAGEVEGRF